MATKRFTFTNSCDGEISSYSFIEISIDPNLLSNYSNEDGIGAYFNSYSCSEEFQELRTQLLKEVMKIINECLTPKQKEVIKMTYFDGKTQNEISEELGKHQTTVHKILQGNIDYNNNKKRYGGALKKIRKVCSANEKIRQLLLKMREKKEEFANY